MHEIKFDGYRVQIHLAHEEVNIYTRRGRDWTKRFKKIANDAWHLRPPRARRPTRTAPTNAATITAIDAFIPPYSSIFPAATSMRKIANIGHADIPDCAGSGASGFGAIGKLRHVDATSHVAFAHAEDHQNFAFSRSCCDALLFEATILGRVVDIGARNIFSSNVSAAGTTSRYAACA
ncbi:ATP-dependent DNA ligase [Bradyrhizobium sp. USDA 3240]